NMLRTHFGIPHIATGDMLRAEIQAGTALGRQAQPILAAGQYVSDEIMIGIVRHRLGKADCAPGFIMDGFPRTVPQAEALDDLMHELGKRFDRVIYLKVPVEELLHRLSGRLVCPTCQRTYPPQTTACAADGSALAQRAGSLLASVLPPLKEACEPGVKTIELDRIADKLIREGGATPGFLGYHGFPRSICVSINDEAVHGIPGNRKIAVGDLVSLDLGL